LALGKLTSLVYQEPFSFLTETKNLSIIAQFAKYYMCYWLHLLWS